MGVLQEIPLPFPKDLNRNTRTQINTTLEIETQREALHIKQSIIVDAVIKLSL